MSVSKPRKWSEVSLEGSGDVWDKKEPLEGKFVSVEDDVGPNKSRMYTIKTEDGREVRVWGSTVLDDKLLSVPRGSYVKLEYEGKLRSKKGAEYHSYRVFVDLNSKPEATSRERHLTLDDTFSEEDMPPGLFGDEEG